MSAPTPGPWVVNRGEWAHITNPLYSGLVALIEHSDDVPLFVCNADQPVDKEEYEANARLIAAAPDLLAALRGITDRDALPCPACDGTADSGHLEDCSFEDDACDEFESLESAWLNVREARAAIAKAEGK